MRKAGTHLSEAWTDVRSGEAQRTQKGRAMGGKRMCAGQGIRAGQGTNAGRNSGGRATGAWNRGWNVGGCGGWI